MRVNLLGHLHPVSVHDSWWRATGAITRKAPPIERRDELTRRLSEDYRGNSTWQYVSAEVEEYTKRDDGNRPNKQRAPVDAIGR